MSRPRIRRTFSALCYQIINFPCAGNTDLQSLLYGEHSRQFEGINTEVHSILGDLIVPLKRILGRISGVPAPDVSRPDVPGFPLGDVFDSNAEEPDPAGDEMDDDVNEAEELPDDGDDDAPAYYETGDALTGDVDQTTDDVDSDVSDDNDVSDDIPDDDASDDVPADEETGDVETASDDDDDDDALSKKADVFVEALNEAEVGLKEALEGVPVEIPQVQLPEVPYKSMEEPLKKLTMELNLVLLQHPLVTEVLLELYDLLEDPFKDFGEILKNLDFPFFDKRSLSDYPLLEEALSEVRTMTGNLVHAVRDAVGLENKRMLEEYPVLSQIMDELGDLAHDYARVVITTVIQNLAASESDRKRDLENYPVLSKIMEELKGLSVELAGLAIERMLEQMTADKSKRAVDHPVLTQLASIEARAYANDLLESAGLIANAAIHNLQQIVNTFDPKQMLKDANLESMFEDRPMIQDIVENILDSQVNSKRVARNIDLEKVLENIDVDGLLERYPLLNDFVNDLQGSQGDGKNKRVARNIDLEKVLENIDVDGLLERYPLLNDFVNDLQGSQGDGKNKRVARNIELEKMLENIDFNGLLERYPLLNDFVNDLQGSQGDVKRVVRDNLVDKETLVQLMEENPTITQLTREVFHILGQLDKHIKDAVPMFSNFISKVSFNYLLLQY